MTRPRTGGGHRVPMVNHHEISRRLRAQPQEWGPVSEYRARYTANSVSRAIVTAGHEARTLPMYKPPGAYETRIEMTEDGWLLEARYVGDVPRETSTEED